MSINVMSLIFDCNIPDMGIDQDIKVSGSSLKFVLLALSDHSNDAGEYAYPSVNTLAKKTNLSRSTCINALKILRDKSLISSEGVSRWQSKVYRLNLEIISQYKYEKPEEYSHYTSPATTPVQPQYQTSPATGLKPSLHQLKNPDVVIGETIYESCDDDGEPVKDKRKKTTRRSTADPRTKHPAIKAYRATCGFYPPKEIYDIVIEALGDKPDIVKLVKLRQEWVDRGYNKASSKWATEWYVKGASSNGRKPKNEPKGWNAVQAEMQRLEAENGI